MRSLERYTDHKTPQFALSCCPLELTGALDKIRSQLELSRPLVATLLKVNLYGPGDFFKSHREYVHVYLRVDVTLIIQHSSRREPYRHDHPLPPIFVQRWRARGQAQ